MERGSWSLTGCKRIVVRYWPTEGWGSTPHSPPPGSLSQSCSPHGQHHHPSPRTHTHTTGHMTTHWSVTHLPTRSSSLSEARGLCFFQMSMVKRVEQLLKMEVSEDIRAAIITAIISPRKPETHTHTRMDRTHKHHLRTGMILGKYKMAIMSLPLGMSSMTSLGKAMLEHPTSAPHTRTHSSGSTHPTVSET